MEKEELTEDLIDGPIQKRRCTDCICCLTFVAFLVSFVAVGVVGFMQGDPYLLAFPHDSSGFQCGRKDRVTADYKYLYYPSPIYEPDYKICLKHCPEIKQQDDIECFKNRWVTECRPRFILRIDNDTSPFFSYASTPFLKRFCLPVKGLDDDLDEAFDRVLNNVLSEGIKGWATDIYQA